MNIYIEELIMPIILLEGTYNFEVCYNNYYKKYSLFYCYCIGKNTSCIPVLCYGKQYKET